MEICSSTGQHLLREHFAPTKTKTLKVQSPKPRGSQFPMRQHAHHACACHMPSAIDAGSARARRRRSKRVSRQRPTLRGRRKSRVRDARASRRARHVRVRSGGSKFSVSGETRSPGRGFSQLLARPAVCFLRTIPRRSAQLSNDKHTLPNILTVPHTTTITLVRASL